METQTGFNLIAAIEAWRLELATQPTLTGETRRELETHLRDTICEMQKRGLNDEESFWLARRRVGKPSELREEFVKANPVVIWRERVFWIAVGLFTINIWSALIRIIGDLLTPSPLYHSPLEFAQLVAMERWVSNLFNWLSLALLAVLVARGRLSAPMMTWTRFFRSRKAFIFIAGSMFLIIQSAEFVSQLIRAYQYAGRTMPNAYNLFYLVNVEQIILITLAAWLLPSVERERPDVSESPRHSSI